MTKWNTALLAAAKAGDDSAIAAVIAHFMPAIRRGARSCVCPGLDFDDAVQEGLIGLLRAVKSFDPAQAAKFESYARISLLNAMRSARRQAGRKKYSPLNSSLPLAETAETPGPEQLLLEREAYTDILLRLDTVLSPLERSVLALHLDGHGTDAVAHALHITPKAAENALGRVRRKLKRGI